ncbi:PAS domain-containing protein [Bacillus sp. OV322]|uniref:PAS domain-containing protein n=1 Tax=Bacillus sp. OV322 TaxID=1882764 RepID=UPI00210E277C|nr:PAS domain-containing protein [Bacillus sp. OV322]
MYVNKGFLDLTGYEKEEVAGKNCRFLQGPETDEDSVQQIRDAISKHEPITIELYNYRKGGSGFWNELLIEPLWVEEENKLYFTGVQKNISSEREKEMLLIESMKENRQLSAPIVPLRKEVSILPIIGVLDSNRYDYNYNCAFLYS